MVANAKPKYLGMKFSHPVYGDYKIVYYKTSREIKIRFLRTGYECNSRVDRARGGNVRDRMQSPNGSPYFIGVGNYKSKDKGGRTTAYERWRRMMERCYSKEYQARFPTYIGCKICDEWHNFQNFAKWHENNYPKDGGEYHLDKDIKGNGKLYSPENCMYVTPSENATQAASTRKEWLPEENPSAKAWSFVAPDGDVVEFINLAEFCRNNGLSESKMIAVSKKKKGYKSHKGYRPVD